MARGVPVRSSFVCARPGCGAKFVAVRLRGEPVCPDCRGAEERERQRLAKQRRDAAKRQQAATSSLDSSS